MVKKKAAKYKDRPRFDQIDKFEKELKTTYNKLLAKTTAQLVQKYNANVNNTDKSTDT